MLQTPSPRRDRFVGRAAELERLRARLDAALAGAGGSVLVAGEPGIGKTRLAEELAAEAERRGVRVLWGRCWEGEGAPAFWPWVQIVRAALRDQAPAALRATMGEGAAEIAQLAPELRARLPELPFPPPLPPEQARFRLFDSLTTFLKRAAERRPLLLILDDLHWADAASALLLRFLAAELADARLLLLGSYRDVEVDAAHPLAATLAALRRERTHDRIALGGLAPDEIARLVRSAPPAGDAAGVEPFALALHRETEGNPFFAGEILRHLAERGGTTAAADLARIGVPDGVREVIGRRLARLSPACRELMDLAAVIGREFTAEDLAQARTTLGTEDGEDRVTLLDLLGEAESARLILAASEASGRYRFSHALVRETLYGDLAPGRRTRLHRDVGEALERRAGQGVTALDALAHHFFEAAADGDATAAIHYARRAVAHALATLAHEQAALHAERALRLLDQQASPDLHQLYEFLLIVGDASLWTIGGTRAKDAFRRAATVARRLDRPDLFARAVLGFAMVADEMTSRAEELITLLDEALVMLDDEHPVLKAEVMARLAWATRSGHVHGKHDAPALADAAIALARHSADAESYLRVVGFAYQALPRGRGRQAILDEALGRAERVVSYFHFQCRDWRLLERLRAGDLDGVDAELAAIEALGRRYRVDRMPVLGLFMGMIHTIRATMRGQFDAAAARIEAMLAVCRRIDNWPVAAQVGEQRFFLELEQDRAAPREATLLRANEQHGTARGHIMLLALYTSTGRTTETRREFERFAADDFAVAVTETNSLFLLALLAEACALLDDRARAETLYRLLRPLDGLHAADGDLVSLGAVARHLGVLAATLGRWDDAERHFADALAMNERMASPPWVAWTRHDRATMLLKRRAATGERADTEVRALLAAAREEAESLGMVRLLAAVERLEQEAETLVDSGGATDPDASLPDGLSPREAEVLRLIAQGSTNAEIAAALVLSTRTIERHAVNIYAKIRARSRAEAVAYAVRHGLG